ncbi:MAG: hypothetical protein WCK08_12390 [Betaproteobacteria bacterium]
MLAISAGLACLQQACAGQASAEIRVQVVSVDSAGARVFCSSDVSPNRSGATVTVVCSTGAVAKLAAPERFTVAHGGAYQYVLQVGNGGRFALEGDSQTRTDSGALWRLVKLGNQEYLEFTWVW